MCICFRYTSFDERKKRFIPTVSFANSFGKFFSNHCRHLATSGIYSQYWEIRGENKLSHNRTFSINQYILIKSFPMFAILRMMKLTTPTNVLSTRILCSTRKCPISNQNLKRIKHFLIVVFFSPIKQKGIRKSSKQNQACLFLALDTQVSQYFCDLPTDPDSEAY